MGDMPPKDAGIGVDTLSVYPKKGTMVEIITSGAIIGERRVFVLRQFGLQGVVDTTEMKHKRLVPQRFVVVERQILIGIIDMFLAGGYAEADKEKIEKKTDGRAQNAV